MEFRVGHIPKLRGLPTPEDGLRALVDQAPRAEAWAERATERMRPLLTWFYRTYRRLATAAVAVLTLWLFVHVMFGANGMVVYRQKRAEYQELQKQLDQLQKQNQQYSERVKSLQNDPKTVEKEAREQLHYARPGEVVYVAPAPPPPPPPSNRSARK